MNQIFGPMSNKKKWKSPGCNLLLFLKKKQKKTEKQKWRPTFIRTPKQRRPSFCQFRQFLFRFFFCTNISKVGRLLATPTLKRSRDKKLLVTVHHGGLIIFKRQKKQVLCRLIISWISQILFPPRYVTELANSFFHPVCCARPADRKTTLKAKNSTLLAWMVMRYLRRLEAAQIPASSFPRSRASSTTWPTNYHTIRPGYYPEFNLVYFFKNRRLQLVQVPPVGLGFKRENLFI